MELARLDTIPDAMRTRETERAPGDDCPRLWVQTRECEWHRVSAKQFRAAEIDRALEICE